MCDTPFDEGRVWSGLSGEGREEEEAQIEPTYYLPRSIYRKVNLLELTVSRWTKKQHNRKRVLVFCNRAALTYQIYRPTTVQTPHSWSENPNGQ
mmetsp:Transcript_31594/g.76594  ORF Transcript_31594/g.76594 Transcript_31594/m.76594 type:complete len:94 (-) Transcript_31594:248-529(-)